MPFQVAYRTEDLWEGEMVGLVINREKILLARVNGQLFAYQDKCSHLSVELSKGVLQGTVLTCSAHHWHYDILTGKGINPENICLPRFPVKEEGGTISIDLAPHPKESIL